MKFQYDLYLLLCVQCWTPDDGHRNCPKNVEFYSKNKFEKLVYLVGFIRRIYHDSRSSECQIKKTIYEKHKKGRKHEKTTEMSVHIIISILHINFEVYRSRCRDECVRVTTAWCVLMLWIEERPPIWRVASNILNKQSQTADKAWSYSFGVGRGAKKNLT